MRPEVWRTVLLVICFFAAVARAQNPDLTGRWQVSITHYGQNDYGRVTLKADGARWTGEMFGDAFTVTLDGSAIEVRLPGKGPEGEALRRPERAAERGSDERVREPLRPGIDVDGSACTHNRTQFGPP